MQEQFSIGYIKHQYNVRSRAIENLDRYDWWIEGSITKPGRARSLFIFLKIGEIFNTNMIVILYLPSTPNRTHMYFKDWHSSHNLYCIERVAFSSLQTSIESLNQFSWPYEYIEVMKVLRSSYFYSSAAPSENQVLQLSNVYLIRTWMFSRRSVVTAMTFMHR
jgi:predicted AlkP superfamily pyrophosphatase or phosphodiesterase